MSCLIQETLQEEYFCKYKRPSNPLPLEKVRDDITGNVVADLIFRVLDKWLEGKAVLPEAVKELGCAEV